MLNQAAMDDHFGYHPKCKDVNLTHISFTDDILIIVVATLRWKPWCDGLVCLYVRLYTDATKYFIFEVDKGRDYFSQAVVSKCLKFGTLHIHYLRMPLATKVWSKLDFELLIDKIQRRFLSWIHRFIFVGRLQLISLIIISITKFCSYAFVCLLLLWTKLRISAVYSCDLVYRPVAIKL